MSSRWQKLYETFDPTHRLDAGEMELFVDRPGSVAGAIGRELRQGFERDGAWVVCGSVGSGKSSELVRLAHRVADDFAVVGVDLARSSARLDLVTPAEVLLAIGAAALHTMRDRWGHTPPRELEEALARAFEVVRQPGRSVELGELLGGIALFFTSVLAPGAEGSARGVARTVASAAGSAVEIPRRPRLGGLVRSLEEGDPDLEQLQAAVSAIAEEISRYRPPVFLVDGLDKLNDTGLIQTHFAATRALASLPCPVVYSGPITLMLSAQWGTAGGLFRRARLANVVVARPQLPGVTVDDALVESGREAIREVVDRRCQAHGLRQSDVFDADALEELITRSGGLLRDAVHLVRRAILAASARGAERAERADVDAAVRELRAELESTLTTRRLDELRHVAGHGEPSGRDEVSTELALHNYVLPYSNGRIWFAPHPLLAGIRDGI